MTRLYCGYIGQFVGSLLLIGGVIYLGGRVFTGTWMRFIGVQWSPLVSGLLGVSAVCVGVLYLVLGPRIRAGQPQAVLVAIVLGWVLMVGLVAHVLILKQGAYECLLWWPVLVDAHAAAYLSRRDVRRE